jgi:uncharacterized protein with ParB-like and HNH nuclease domain/alkylated DNA nucleotide flippase Atl1
MVKAVETTLAQLLEGTKQYQVPLFQRTYSWKDAQLERLWDDIVKLAADRHEPGSDVTHFIGSLVLAPSPGIAAAGLQEFLVVDGQQRLTTLTLLLAAIRDHRAATEDPTHFERINDKFLINRWEKGAPPKLMPTQQDQASYLACIHRTPHAGGGDPVGTAYRYFRGRLALFDDPLDPFDVQRIEDTIVSGLSVVCITSQAGDNAHRIFESLNNAGMPLSQADLIRNYVFMRLPSRGQHVYDTMWKPLQESLTSDQLVLLFWLDLVQHDDTVIQTDTYSRQEKRLKEVKEETAIEAEVERFARLGRLLKIILEPGNEQDPGVRAQLNRLNEWGTTTVYPVLLYMLELREQQKATSTEIVDAMKFVESFFVRRVVLGKATANINRILLRAVQEVRGQPSVAEALRAYLSTGRKSFATDAEVRHAAKTVPFYWSGKASQKKLILQWIEESLGSKEPVGSEKLTIEHVLPQTMTKTWRDELRADLEPGESVDAAHTAIVHLLGNLTLSGYNPVLGNKPYSFKQPKLAKSGLHMNQEIAGHAQWTRSEILERCDRLADIICTIWPGPIEVAAVEDLDSPWPAMNQVLAAMPAGSWTTYGDLAAVVGTHPVPLGQRLANVPAVNAHRVLSAGGVVATNFRWLDPSETATPREVLENEGVQFRPDGSASPDNQLSAEDLASLIGVDISAAAPVAEADYSDEQTEKFFAQLDEYQTDDVVEAIDELGTAWVDLGGAISFGDGFETTMFLLTSGGRGGFATPWPFAIRPSGRVVVPFQFMTSRPPFDRSDMRREFLQRLNGIPGIALPEAKLGLRPSFNVSVLANDEARDSVIRHLAWYIGEVQK